MKSRKQSNRSPRAFKNKSSERGWSGGRRTDGALPPLRSLFVAPKKSPPPPPSETPPPAPPSS